ncbi:MAG: bifunctional phosphopantothenoylcysteine decarboxylase/phosphopantothenate--cysteine ligase CoaBC [Candidatus Omnitrophica bacterium]|nr:bifunctional phosphopantothenoylcysteine decarboxylase/phosphopantothenate--cysteine ligase CoaBC [Candidatus Omnitrophota bacterium]
MPVEKKQIVLGVTGSIAAYKSADLVRRLMDSGYSVSVVMTKEAEHFIAPLTFESLSGKKVLTGRFKDWVKDGSMSHIALAQNADAILIAPATANIIAKLANGFADDILTCAVLATSAPVLIAPAMNETMYKNKIVQANCKKLKDLGFIFINPVKGQLACGINGEGHFEEPVNIIKVLKTVI